MRRFLLIASGLAFAATIAACGDSGDDTATDGDTGADAASPVDATIIIDEFAFSSPEDVAVGETISIVNVDGAPHTWTSADDLFDSGTIDPAGGSFETTIDEPGTYAFVCTIHPAMTGSITIVE